MYFLVNFYISSAEKSERKEVNVCLKELECVQTAEPDGRREEVTRKAAGSESHRLGPSTPITACIFSSVRTEGVALASVAAKIAAHLSYLNVTLQMLKNDGTPKIPTVAIINLTRIHFVHRENY